MTYAWHTTSDGRQVYARVRQRNEHRSSLPCPMIIKDTITPVRSMADGKMYDSMSGLRNTYKPSGNPQGQEYVEIGDAPMQGRPASKGVSEAEVANLLDKAEAQMARGELA